MLRIICIVLTITLLIACKKSSIDVNDNELKGPDGADIEGINLNPILENLPQPNSRLTRINVRVSGLSIANYIYKVAAAETLDCANATGYSLNPIGTPIDIDISTVPDGMMGLCLLAQHENLIWQTYDQAIRYEWVKETGALPSPENLRFIHGSESITLIWDEVQDSEGFLIARALTLVDWKPEDGAIYEIGRHDLVDVIASGSESSLVDSGLVNDTSYHYYVFSYDENKRYSPPSIISVIPSLNDYAWVKVQPGAHLENAVVAGTRFDGSTDLYLCRGQQLNQAGQVVARLPGKFVPDKKGDPSEGVCYVANRQQTTDFEILVLTSGTFDEALAWSSVSQGPSFPAQSIIGGNSLETDLFICRFKTGMNDVYIPGYVALNQSCAVDAVGVPNNTTTSADFEILLAK